MLRTRLHLRGLDQLQDSLPPFLQSITQLSILLKLVSPTLLRSAGTPPSRESSATEANLHDYSKMKPSMILLWVLLLGEGCTASIWRRYIDEDDIGRKPVIDGQSLLH
jgi:hypothetical protein